MKASTTVRLSVAVVVAMLALPGIAAAQVDVGGMRLQGEVVPGFLYYLDRPSPSRRGKFEEYRDLSPGPFLDRLDLRLSTPDDGYGVELFGTKWGHEDQNFLLEAGRLGLWSFGFEWDQTPHIYSTTARTREREAARGVWTLDTVQDLRLWNSNAEELGEVGTRWDTARFTIGLTPTPELDLRAGYTRIRKDGDRPFSMAFGSPGSNFLEILAPIEHTVHDARFRVTFAQDNWQVQGGYTFSMFDNDTRALLADNPCFGLTAAVTAGGCGTGDGALTVARTGQMSLEPDNMAHTFSIGGGVSLPMRSRINVNLAYSLRLQDTSFLPHTINPGLASSALALPQKSLDGAVGTTLLNFFGSTRPLRPLTISLRYRYYDLDDMSDEIEFPGHVVNDRTIVEEARLAGRWDYTRQNADLDFRWRFGQPLAVTVGGGWERWERNEHREARKTDELFGKAVLDATPWDWLLARLTYRPSFRRYDTYETTAHLAHTVVEDLPPGDPAIAQFQSLLLRKYDQANRDRHSIEAMLQLTPIERLTTSLIGEYRVDDYYDSRLGLQDSIRWSAGFDTTWRPIDRLALFAGYVHEVIYQRQRSRSRPVTGSTTFDFPDFDWISDNTDTVDTAHIGVNLTLIPRVLEWNTAASYSYALGEIDTRNPGPVVSGTAAQRTTATAKRVPAFEDQLFRLDTTLHYRFWKGWTASLGYAWESFQKNDWRTDRLTPYIDGVGLSSIFLGNDWRNYDAHMLIAKIGYRF